MRSDILQVTIERAGLVVLTFLLLTVLMAGGALLIEIQSGFKPFAQSASEYDTMETIEDEFLYPNQNPTTQIVQSGRNVLSRESLLRMLRLQERLKDRESLRVRSMTSVASVVATRLNPEANTLHEKKIAIRKSTRSRITKVVKSLRGNRELTRLISDDYSRKSGTASATILLVKHSLPVESPRIITDTVPVKDIQYETRHVVSSVEGEFYVYGRGIISNEFSSSVFDSLKVLIPVSSVLITFFLILAYRDPLDVFVGSTSVVLLVIWTLGFVGYSSITFSLMQVSIIPLLSGVGIDFSVHIIDRYREEKAELEEAMKNSMTHLISAFGLVVGTTLIGFSANLISPIKPIRDFGIVASVGMVFAFLIFAFFMPSLKVLMERQRRRYSLSPLSTQPLGSEGSLIGKLLGKAAAPAKAAPTLFLIVVVISSLGVGYYATGVGTTFQRDNFLPLDKKADQLEKIPGISMSDYTIRGIESYLSNHFRTSGSERVSIYVEAPMTKPHILTALKNSVRSPPPEGLLKTETRTGETRVVQNSVLSLLRENGSLPKSSLEKAYSRIPENVRRKFLSDNLGGTRLVLSTKGETKLEKEVSSVLDIADNIPYETHPTGHKVIYDSVADKVRNSALSSFGTSLILIFLFLVLVYGWYRDSILIGVINLFPILVSVVLVVATMRFLGIKLNAVTSTILSITMGIGIDYSVHMTHRIASELEEDGDTINCIERALKGTGGALTGSMVTDVIGIGSAVFALTPMLVSFGILMSLSVFYSYLSSIIILPSMFVVLKRNGRL